jgi:hypothetical protein
MSNTTLKTQKRIEKDHGCCLIDLGVVGGKRAQHYSSRSRTQVPVSLRIPKSKIIEAQREAYGSDLAMHVSPF